MVLGSSEDGWGRWTWKVLDGSGDWTWMALDRWGDGWGRRNVSWVWVWVGLDSRWGDRGRWTADLGFVGRTWMDVGGCWGGGARGTAGISFLAFCDGWFTGGLLTRSCFGSGWLLRWAWTRWAFRGIRSVGYGARSRSFSFLFLRSFSFLDIVLLRKPITRLASAMYTWLDRSSRSNMGDFRRFRPPPYSPLFQYASASLTPPCRAEAASWNRMAVSGVLPPKSRRRAGRTAGVPQAGDGDERRRL